MKRNEFYSMVVPFINVRGGDIVYPFESLEVAVENAIQDIFNEYRWSWLFTTKKVIIADWIDGNGYYLYDIGDVKAIERVEIYDSNSGGQIEFEKVATITDLGDYKYLPYGQYVIMSKPLDCSITYIRDYTWDLFNPDMTREIPMPNKMIPALYYLVLSQIDIIEVTQAESQTYSNYGKYQNKIKILKENDLPISGSLQGGNRY